MPEPARTAIILGLATIMFCAGDDVGRIENSSGFFEVPSSRLKLEYTFSTPHGKGPFPAVVICHPDPRMGGTMNNHVVLALEGSLLKAGIAVLRFNFRGAGKSQGAFSNMRGETEDARAALAFLRNQKQVHAERVSLAFLVASWVEPHLA